jgi:hypothetical protein
MSTTPTVLGNVPLEYTDPVSGKQVSIPLSALKFTNGQLSVDSSIWKPAVPGFVASLLATWAQQGLIVPVAAAAPKPAMTLTAGDAGSTGNGIKVTISNVKLNIDPTQTTFNIKIEETDTYTGLTPASIVTILGTDKAAGTQPGLVHVVQSTTPANGMPAAISKAAMAVPSGGSNAQKQLMNNAATPAPFLTLEAKRAGTDGTQTTVTIAVQATTFDLTAYWSKTVTGATLATLQSNVAYELKILPPPSGIISPPAGASAQLSGGSDGSSPSAASAIVFAAQ